MRRTGECRVAFTRGGSDLRFPFKSSAEVHEKISPTLQPVVDGRGGLLPLHVTLAP